MVTSLKRTTIFLTTEQHERLRHLAFEQRTSMAKLIRDAAIKVMNDAGEVRRELQDLSVKASPRLRKCRVTRKRNIVKE